MPTQRYPTASALLAENAHRDGDDHGRIRFPYNATLFGRRDLTRVVNYGLALGLEVDRHRLSGVFTQTGVIAAAGTWGAMREFLQALCQITETP